MLGKYYSNLHNWGGGVKHDLCNVYKSLLAALIIAITALAIIPVRAFAEPVELTDFEYSVSDNGVEITGYNGSEGDVVIPSIIDGNPVTAIGNSAFYQCTSLTSIKFPSSLKSIGRNSFWQCSSLRSVEIPEGVEIIDNMAFVQCTSLTSVTLPSTITTVGNSAFSGCTSLTSITLPSMVTTVDNRAFSGCTSLDNIIYQYGLNVDNAGIPDASTQVKYTVGDGKVTITEIILGDGKTAVTIPDSIGGKAVAEIDKDLMQKVAHTHTGGTATCNQKAECALCGNEYGDFAAHNYADGVCVICNTPDPDYTPPTETSTSETEPTGTSPSIPSRPSYPSSPAVTTAAAETTTITTTTAAEKIIADGDYTGEDVSAGAGIYEDSRDISEKSTGLIALAIGAVIACAVIVKKIVF